MFHLKKFDYDDWDFKPLGGNTHQITHDFYIYCSNRKNTNKWVSLFQLQATHSSGILLNCGLLSTLTRTHEESMK